MRRLLFAGWGALLLVVAVACSTARPAEPPARQQSDTLRRVVAVYRHGVRAPLDGFTDALANAHSDALWPTLGEWKVRPGGTWGDLTQRGEMLAQAMGRYHAELYKTTWGDGFEVFLWADVDNRTRDTAEALKAGFESENVKDVTVKSLAPGGSVVDPLFHPFKAGCGKPVPAELNRVADGINANWRRWAEDTKREQFSQLDRVLSCSGTDCVKLKSVMDEARAWKEGEPRGTSPIVWRGNFPGGGKPHYEGRFPYASSASEAFVLEYANGMTYAWNRFPGEMPALITSMLGLHEFYFDKTARDPYLAGVQGSNLIQQIQSILNGTEHCSRIPTGARFAGLVGHDTNLASVGARLNLTWRFAKAPDAATRGVPANDALPAGALLFELWDRGGQSVVTIWYTALSLEDMRTCNGVCDGFAVPVENPACRGLPQVCDIPLQKFNDMLTTAIDVKFLSPCLTCP